MTSVHKYPRNPLIVHLRGAPRLVSVLLLLLLLAIQLTGCASLGLKNTPPQEVPVEPTPPDSLATAAADTLAEVFESLEPPVTEPLLPVGPDGYTPLEELEALTQECLQLLANREPALALDHLYVLNEELSRPLPVVTDSLYQGHHRSLQRRVWFMQGLQAEMVSFDENGQLADSLLATSYGRLANGAFPDSLVPATGVSLPAFTADLLKVENSAVERWVNYFTGNGRRSFQRWLDRKTSCEDLVIGILREYDLPEDLIFVSVIESGIGSHAVSSVGAVGPWQFMPDTGKHYRLRQSWWVDERRDLEMSTRAAARHLTYLHDMFGDWALVLAAYNSGEGRVARRIRLHGHDNFWDMRLPSQTTAYVPKFIAAARIGRNPEKYGFEVRDVTPLRYDVVKVRDATDLELMARCAGVESHLVKELNPALLRGASPPGIKDYPVRVPAGTGDKATASLSKVPLDKRLTWRRHKVQRGETLGHIARQYGSRVHDIAQLNRMQDVHLIRPGDQLLIPMPAQLADAARQRADEKGHYVPPSGYKRVSYRVKKGDTLGGIGRKLGVSVRHLRKVNGLYKTNLIYPGQKLYAYRP